MLCPQSSNRRELSTEMMIHNGRLDGAMTDLFTFPRACATGRNAQWV